jgi:hypothetical protein
MILNSAIAATLAKWIIRHPCCEHQARHRRCGAEPRPRDLSFSDGNHVCGMIHHLMYQ